MEEDLALRQQIDRMLPASITDEEWAFLVNKRYISEVVNGDATPSDVAEALREYRATFGGVPAPKPHGGRRTGVSRLSPPRHDPRDRAITTVLAAQASKKQKVRTFRRYDIHKGGELLEQDEVEPWLTKQAEMGSGPVGMWLTGVFVPPSERSNIEAALQREYGALDYDTDGNLLPFKVTVMVDPTRIEQHVVFHELRCFVRNPETGREYFHTVVARPNSVLERLRQLSLELAQEFGWHEYDATLFILTGKTPEFHMMTPSADVDMIRRTKSYITLRIYPLLSPSKVVEWYHFMQRLVLRSRPRALSEKHVQLVCFIADRPTDETWAQRMVAWNQEYPKWKYKDDTNFGRDCRNAQARLLHPDFNT